MANKIFITGDCHATIDFHKLNSDNFPEGKTLDKDDYVIVCGDMGVVWDGSGEDKWLQKWYANKPWTTLFIDGNHENHQMLAAFPVEEWHGGKVHRINDSLIHLMRGQIFDICGKKIFTMGGAVSSDKAWRKEGISWWPEELPSAAEIDSAIDILNISGNKVNIVLSHCAPTDWITQICSWYSRDNLTNFLNYILHNVEYDDWYFGHYHVDREYGKLHALYNNIIKIE